MPSAGITLVRKPVFMGAIVGAVIILLMCGFIDRQRRA